MKVRQRTALGKVIQAQFRRKQLLSTFWVLLRVSTVPAPVKSWTTEYRLMSTCLYSH